MSKDAKETIRSVLHGGLAMPGVLRPLGRLLYHGGVAAAELFRLLYAWLVVKPIVTSVCRVGRGLRIERIPYIRGPGRVTIGSDVYISGQLGIAFSRHSNNRPELVIGDRTFIGHQSAFCLAQRIEVGSDCRIAAGVIVQDNDGHPLDADKRLAGAPVDPADVKPVRIGNNVWIGSRAVVLKGVTVGDNAVIGACSVVTRDVPANVIVAGNPAGVVR